MIAVFMHAPIAAEQLTSGTNIDTAKQAMSKADYKPTQLGMLAMEKGERLAFWDVGEGYLIIRYSLLTEKIIEISYHLMSDHAKDARVSFNLQVKSFDTASGEMVVKTGKESP